MFNKNPVTFQKKFDPLRALPSWPARALCHVFFELLAKATRSVSHNYSHRHALIRSGGFTLLELLVVVALIAIVAGTAIVSLEGIEDGQAESLTQSEMVALTKALRSFKQDVGHFPDDAGLISDAKKMALLYYCQASDITKVTTPEVSFDAGCVAWDPDLRRGWRGPYLSSDFYKNGSDQDNSYQDGWGEDYRLLDVGNSNIRIVSYGADKTYGGVNTTNICQPNVGEDDLVLCLLK